MDYGGITIEDIRTDKISKKPFEYITQSLEGEEKEKFLENYNTGTVDQDIVTKICEIAENNLKNGLIVIYSAGYCIDCQRNVPPLALISQICKHLDIVVRSIKRDSEKKWVDLPPEFKAVNIEKIPTVIVFEGNGKELGRIIENPDNGKTMEEALLDIVKQIIIE